MPCNSDYMEASSFERRMSQVVCLLEEIATGIPVDPTSGNWQGYHPSVYNGAMKKEEADKLVERLCSILKNTDPKKIKEYSLEMQVWWRDHQKADAQRDALEKSKQHEEQLRKQALSKLSKAERNALGLE
jgi:predicted Rossmann fold nucleotide-binding protein DprA/Smf involved in DNA uptake